MNKPAIDLVTLQDGESANIVNENIENLKVIFPEAFGEGGVNFETLRQLLGDIKVIDEGEEKYGLNWHGKKKARQIALAPSTGTLLPRPEESVEWDVSSNVFIEGDNLEVLKLLQKSYAGKVKLIYIDPPYNTGKEFVYPDNYQDNLDTYLRYTGQVDDQGMKFSTNTEASGRKHTNWLSMMYPRLKIARNLMRDDGVIFISIDDAELANLRCICDEIFGQNNFCGIISRATGTRMGLGSSTIASELDYILIYSKSEGLEFDGLPMTDSDLSIYDQEDEKGRYLTRSLRRTGGENRREDRPSMFYPVHAPDGTEVFPIAPAGYESRWVCSKDTYFSQLEKGMIEWKKVVKDGAERWQVYQKHYVGEARKQPSNLWNKDEGNKKATRDLNSLFEEEKVFDHPKPVGLISKIIQLSTSYSTNDIILDFFAGSATTGQSVFEQNASDNGNRRFILVQLPEVLDEKNNAQKVAVAVCDKLGVPRNIAEISKERLRRASTKVRGDYNTFSGDVGFKVFKLVESNIKAWRPDRTDLEKTLLSHQEHLVKGRTEQDVLYELLIKRGIDLAVPIESKSISGKNIFSIGYGVLFACLDASIAHADVESVAQGILNWYRELTPSSDTHVFFRDSAFSDDIAKTNMAAILEQNGITHVRSL